MRNTSLVVIRWKRIMLYTFFLDFRWFRTTAFRCRTGGRRRWTMRNVYIVNLSIRWPQLGKPLTNNSKQRPALLHLHGENVSACCLVKEQLVHGFFREYLADTLRLHEEPIGEDQQAMLAEFERRRRVRETKSCVRRRETSRWFRHDKSMYRQMTSK